MDARPPRSLACSSARAPPCMRSYPASLGKGAPPSTTAGRAARDRCSGRRRTSASRSCSKRTLPSNMAGCARQLRWSCKLLAVQLLRERERLVCVSRETVRRALHRLGFRWRRPRPVPPEKDSEEQIIEKHARLEDVLQMTEQEAGSFFQDAYPSWRPTPRWAFAGCAEGNRSPFALREPTARCGSAGRSTSRRGASTGSRENAETTSFSSSCSTSSGGHTAATRSCILPQTTTQAI